jgi:hypothetical protein
MQVSVRGARISGSEWQAARRLPVAELPVSEAQRKTAESLRVRVEDYARGAYAEHLSQERLLQETERFALWLDTEVRKRFSRTTIERVTLDTFGDKYEVVVAQDRQRLTLRIDEKVVEAIFESGSLGAQESLGRILDLNLSAKVA